jgi:hypothetical protein
MRISVYVHSALKHFKPHRTSCRHYRYRKEDNDNGFWKTFQNTAEYRTFANKLKAEGLDEFDPCKHCNPEIN